MAPSVKREVLQSEAPLGLIIDIDNDFYMATFRGGKVQKVNNTIGGPPRRVRRVLDFDSKSEIEKEEALIRRRKELASILEFELPTDEEEKTLAEELLEMKMSKKAGALATVQRKKLGLAKKVKKVKRVNKVNPEQDAAPEKNVLPLKEAVPIEKVVSIEEVVPTEEVIPTEEVVRTGDSEVVPTEEVCPTEVVVLTEEVVPMEEVVPLEEEVLTGKVASTEERISVEEVVLAKDCPRRKKRKRKSISILQTCSKLLDPSSGSQGDDETLAEFLKKSFSSTGRASSDNTGIKVFQRRKVKLKSVRRRASSAGEYVSSRNGNIQSSSILLCDDLCACKKCGPLDLVAPKTVECPVTGSTASTAATSVLTSCSVSTHSDDVLENSNFEGLSTNEPEQLSHRDSCMEEFDTLTLPDDPHDLPVLHHHVPIDDTDDIQELTEEQFQDARQVPSGSELPALGLGFSCSGSPASYCPENSHVERYDEYLDACNDNPELCDSDMPEVIDSHSTQQLPEESSGLGDVGPTPCAFNTESSNFSFGSLLNMMFGRSDHTHPAVEGIVPAVTPVELERAEERIESIIDTLVTPDDLLPTHLSASTSSASKGTKKKRKRRRFSESLGPDLATEGSHLKALSVDNLRISLRQEEGSAVPMSVDLLTSATDNVPSSVSDIEGEVASSATSESSDLLGQQITDEGVQEHTVAPEPTLSLLPEGDNTPAACSMDTEVVPPSSQEDTFVNTEECTSNGSNILVPSTDAVEVVGTPTESTSCDEGCEIFQRPVDLDATERDGDVGSSSTSKALFSNLKSNALSKRNRKSFSPKSQAALLEASRTERSTPPFKIKLMKSNLSGLCSNQLFSQKSVRRESSPQEQDFTPNESGQDVLECDVEHAQLATSLFSRPLSPPPQTSDDSPNISASSPSEHPLDCNTHIIPGSPEYKKEPSVSSQTGAEPVSLCTPDNSVTYLPCSQGSLHIDVECHPETPSDPKTPNENLEPTSQQPKSILKIGTDACRGICQCHRCVPLCDQSRTARKFIRDQMRLADNIARKLLVELQNMRTLVDDTSPFRAEGEAATSASNSPSEKAKGALDSAKKAEDWATKEILKMNRDAKRVCHLIETGPRRPIFADDAGRQLCHIRLLPAKKTLSKESLLPAKNL